MIMKNLVPYVGAGEHPRSATAAFDRTSGHFRLPRNQCGRHESECVYEFNSLGFRGSEYDPSAAFRVFVCGCSYTFGMGVETDRTWPAVFTRLASAELGVPLGKVMFQNFSQIGASNNYIARTIIRQCDRAPPTLAIAASTHANRTEYLHNNEIRNLGYWNVRPDRQDTETQDSPGRRFFKQYSDNSGLQNLLVNMVFFQKAMESRNIPYIILWVDIERFDKIQEILPTALYDYYRVLDKSRISRISIKQPGIRVDTSDGHPGPQSHERFAPALVDEFKHRILESRPPRSKSRSAILNLDLRRRKPSSVGQIVRDLLRNATGTEPTDVRLTLADTLAVEHFDDSQPIEIDVERFAWSISTAHRQAAFADYVTPDILRFNFWLNVLMAQEFSRACGGQIKIIAPDYWRPQRDQCSPVLRELLELLATKSFSPVRTQTSQLEVDNLSLRLDRARRRNRRSPILLLRRSYCGWSEPSRQEDPNIYPLW